MWTVFLFILNYLSWSGIMNENANSIHNLYMIEITTPRPFVRNSDHATEWVLVCLCSHGDLKIVGQKQPPLYNVPNRKSLSKTAAAKYRCARVQSSATSQRNKIAWHAPHICRALLSRIFARNLHTPKRATGDRGFSLLLFCVYVYAYASIFRRESRFTLCALVTRNWIWLAWWCRHRATKLFKSTWWKYT